MITTPHEDTDSFRRQLAPSIDRIVRIIRNSDGTASLAGLGNKHPLSEFNPVNRPMA